MIGDRPAEPIAPRESTHDGMRQLEFTQQSLHETTAEALTPRDFFGFRLLQFSEFSSWSDVANWANALFPAAVIGDELQAEVQKVRKLDSDQARVSAALQFVQNEIRYFSVSLGESSHRPAPPDEVERRRYSDCKDKSYLLIALLRELGIQTQPVILQMGRRGGLEKTFPSPQFFDHVIVQVMLGGKLLYLDPTRLGQHERLDRMGQAHEGAQVLVVAPDTNALSTISTDNIAELVHQETLERATLSGFDKEATLETKITLHGVAAENSRLRLERLSHDQLVRLMGGLLERRYPSARLVDEPLISDDQINNVFTLTATYKVPKLAVERTGTWIVAFSPDNLKQVVMRSPTATRATPLSIPGYPFEGTYSFEMTFPDTVSAVTDPRAQTIKNKYFNTTISAYFRGNIARISVDLATLKSSVDAADSAKYGDDLQAADKAIGGFFAVNKSSIKSTDPAVAVDLPQRLRKQRQEVIDKTTETIKDGKPSGTDLSETYCVRNNAFSDLQRHDEALQDSNAALRLAPNAINMLACRGINYFNAGQFEKSITDYSKALSLGAKEAELFRIRGASRLYLGQLEEARSDLERGSAVADKEAKTYFDLWLVAVGSRLGKPVPDLLPNRPPPKLTANGLARRSR